MSSLTGIQTRLTVCSSCGHRGRLVIATGREVISRCHVCGDEQRTEPEPTLVLSGAATVMGQNRRPITR
jgi:hypothetical protein